MLRARHPCWSPLSCFIVEKIEEIPIIAQPTSLSHHWWTGVHGAQRTTRDSRRFETETLLGTDNPKPKPIIFIRASHNSIFSTLMRPSILLRPTRPRPLRITFPSSLLV